MVMKLYKEFNILEDKKLLVKINIFSIIVLLVTGALVAIWHFLLNGKFEITLNGLGFLWAFGGFAVSIVIHELIHGYFFKFFADEDNKQVKYGYAKGMFYAANPGVIYTRGQFLVIGLAPFVLISLLYMVLGFLGLDSAVLWGVFILHTAGCAGDFWYTYEITRNPLISHCEDTPTGLKLFVGGDK